MTSRLIEGDIGTIEEATEEDLLETTHGDVTLTLNNQDGAIERFFARIKPADTYEVIIDRLRPERRRMKRDRLFGGVLDLPWSLTYDRTEKTAEVRAFSYSKLLERTSGEGVKRVITGRTLTSPTSTSSSVVNVSSTTDIERDDEIEISNDTTTETQIVRRITSATQLEIVAAGWANVFATGETVKVNTPYLRNKGIDYLADQLFAKAGIRTRVLQAERPIATFPIPTPLSTKNLAIDGAGNIESFRVLSVKGGKIAGWGSANRKTMPTPTGEWTDDGAESARIDWTVWRTREGAAGSPPGVALT